MGFLNVNLFHLPPMSHVMFLKAGIPNRNDNLPKIVAYFDKIELFIRTNQTNIYSLIYHLVMISIQ